MFPCNLVRFQFYFFFPQISCADCICAAGFTIRLLMSIPEPKMPNTDDLGGPSPAWFGRSAEDFAMLTELLMPAVGPVTVPTTIMRRTKQRFPGLHGKSL